MATGFRQKACRRRCVLWKQQYETWLTNTWRFFYAPGETDQGTTSERRPLPRAEERTLWSDQDVVPSSTRPTFLYKKHLPENTGELYANHNFITKRKGKNNMWCSLVSAPLRNIRI